MQSLSKASTVYMLQIGRGNNAQTPRDFLLMKAGLLCGAQCYNMLQVHKRTRDSVVVS